MSSVRSVVAATATARCWRWALLAGGLLTVGVRASEPEPVDERAFFELSLEELMQVRVTAQKREEDAQDVPLSVAVLRGEALAALNASGMDLRQLSFRVPSLLIESSFGRTFPRLYLRGMGNTDFDLLASQPVSLIVDEVVLENPLLKGFPLFDLDRVEVLRGPQGTLFGRNTPAGIVKFESRKPEPTFSTQVNSGVGSYGSANVDGALNLPLRDGVALRLSMLSQTRNDWIDNAVPAEPNADQLGGYDDKAGRVQLRLQPNPKFDLLLNYHFRDADANASIFMANIIERGSNEFVDGFAYDTVYHDAGAQNEQRIELQGLNTRLSVDLGPLTLFYVGGYETATIFSRGDIDGGYGACFLVAVPAGQNPCDRSRYGGYERGAAMGPGFIPFPSETSVAMPDHGQLSHELRVASNELGAADFQLGVFWFSEDLTIENTSYDSLAGGQRNGRSTQTMATDAWAVFGTLEYDWTTAVRTVTGLRYSADARRWRGRQLQVMGGGTPLATTAEVEDSQLSWDASALYKQQENVRWYGRLAKGFRAPSIQGRNLLFSQPPTAADSETLISLEAGLKSEWWQRRARLNAAVFRYEARGQQLTAVGGETNVARLLNAYRSHGKGFEVESEFTPTPRLQLNAAFSYNRTKLDDDQLTVAVCGSGCTVLDPLDSQGRARIDGNPLPQSPEWIADVSARYARDAGPGELFVYTDWAYRSAVNFFLYESAEYRSDPLLEIGLRLGYVWTSGENRFELALLGRNITDATALQGGIDFNNLAGFLNEPRYWGLEFKAQLR